MIPGRYRSHGKLLISGEYAVMDGALAWAVPTRHGQTMEVALGRPGRLQWTAWNHDDTIWFRTEFRLPDLQPLIGGDTGEVQTLHKLLAHVRKENPHFLQTDQGFDVTTQMDFPKDWGLGSSATLVHNLGQWAGTDSFALQAAVFGGSGYDIASARHDTPILYRLAHGKPQITKVMETPPFRDQLYFVHLNQKQNSREGIADYRRKRFDREALIAQVSHLTEKMVQEKKLSVFEGLMTQHEALLSHVLGIAPIKERLFPDYFGAIKSLGAWGGDFVLATGNEKTPAYFKDKGFHTVIPFGRMALSS